jgi:hypothetical protein
VNVYFWKKARGASKEVQIIVSAAFILFFWEKASDGVLE